MDLLQYLKQVLKLDEDPAIELTEEEPAFVFSLEHRRERDE